MAKTIALDMNQFALPESEKVAKVFERLMNINAAVTQNGVREVYSERHDQYEESYAIGFQSLVGMKDYMTRRVGLRMWPDHFQMEGYYEWIGFMHTRMQFEMFILF